MFGFGVPEFTVLLICVGGFWAFHKYRSATPGEIQNYRERLLQRKCLVCGYVGRMKTWLSNYGLPQFLILILALFFIVPGLVFIAWGWGKYKCPSCGALAKNIAFQPATEQIEEETKCPFCAETIKAAAKICKHCSRDLSLSV